MFQRIAVGVCGACMVYGGYHYQYVRTPNPMPRQQFVQERMIQPAFPRRFPPPTLRRNFPPPVEFQRNFPPSSNWGYQLQGGNTTLAMSRVIPAIGEGAMKAAPYAGRIARDVAVGIGASAIYDQMKDSSDSKQNQQDRDRSQGDNRRERDSLTAPQMSINDSRLFDPKPSSGNGSVGSFRGQSPDRNDSRNDKSSKDASSSQSEPKESWRDRLMDIRSSRND